MWFFGNKNRLSNSDELAKIKPAEAIGRTIVCEDGIPRMVHEIVPSFKWPWKYVINEQDPDSKAGHYVNTISLCAQILGKPVPSRESQEAFAKVIRVKFKVGDDGTPLDQ